MTLTKSALAALLAAALFAVPASAQTAEELKKATERLDQAIKDLQAAKDALKIDDLRTKATTIDTKLTILDQDIQEIKRDIQELRRRMGDRTSTALRPDYDAATARSQARVRVINTHPFEMSVVLNNRSYRLASGEERLIPVPPGFYHFEVLQIPGEVRTGDLAAGQTKTFTIFPIP